jgi:hypothetical protein
MRRLFSQVVVADVPPELDMCLDCRKVHCTEEAFRDCPARKQRAADLRAASADP